MAQTLYPAAFAADVSPFDMGLRPGLSTFPAPNCSPELAPCSASFNPGRTHRFYAGAPVVPFGFGLSYTSFSYALADAPQANVSLDRVREHLASRPADASLLSTAHTAAAEPPLARFEVEVSNTGAVASDDVVLGFLVPPGAGEGGVPRQMLFGFERVHVLPGESVRVALSPNLLDFTQPDHDGVRKAHAGEYTVRFGVAETAAFGMGYLEHRMVAV